MSTMARKYEMALAEATSYDEWRQAASALDHLDGKEEWREEPESPDYDYKLLASRVKLLTATAAPQGPGPPDFPLARGTARQPGQHGQPGACTSTAASAPRNWSTPTSTKSARRSTCSVTVTSNPCPRCASGFSEARGAQFRPLRPAAQRWRLAGPVPHRRHPRTGRTRYLAARDYRLQRRLHRRRHAWRPIPTRNGSTCLAKAS